MKKSTLILGLVFVILVIVLIKQSLLEIIYVVPQTNTKSFPYISKSLKFLNKKLDYTMKLCDESFPKMKYLYKNAYGSGFINNNPIPNDLDVSVGVYLGEYDYDGTNSLSIANDIENKVSTFHELFYAVVDDKFNPVFLTDMSVVNSLALFSSKKKQTIKNVSTGIDNVFQNKTNVINLSKYMEDKLVNYTLMLQENEVLLNDYIPMTLFSNVVKYNKTMPQYLREITVVPDFFVDIKDTRTKEVKRIELIEESFLGQRFQLSRRFFVPIIFFGKESAEYLKTLDYLNDDKKFLETRLFNYNRHMDEISNLIKISLFPVKTLKRMQQCTDLIYPALKDEDRDKIYSDIKTILENDDVKTINEYLNSINVISKLTKSSYLLHKAVDNKHFAHIIKISDMSLEKLSTNQKYKDVIFDLKKSHNEFLLKLNSINSEKSLNEFNHYIDDSVIIPVNTAATKIINRNISDKKALMNDVKMLKKITEDAGFQKISIYWIDENTIAIEKNDLTKNISPEKLALENNFPKAKYILEDKSKIYKYLLEIPMYVRFNTTSEQDENWENLQKIIIDDKKNFKLKRKYVF